MAQIDHEGAAETIQYLYTDHLYTPRLATDRNQNVTWRWDGEAFGGDAAQEFGARINLRFPGQYFDSESGLFYNWMRYYDPQTRRYITSDPIGLIGGLNTYGYVGGNSVNLIDPIGLLKNDVSIGGSIPFIGGFDIGLFVTDGASDLGCNTDAGIFFQINKPISGGGRESGVGKLKLGPAIGVSKGGRGNTIQTGGEFFIGANGLGVAVSSPSGSGAIPDGVAIEGGVVAALGGDQTVNFSLSISDLTRLAGKYSANPYPTKSSG